MVSASNNNVKPIATVLINDNNSSYNAKFLAETAKSNEGSEVLVENGENYELYHQEDVQLIKNDSKAMVNGKALTVVYIYTDQNEQPKNVAEQYKAIDKLQYDF